MTTQLSSEASDLRVGLTIDAIDTVIVDLPTIRPHGFAKLTIDGMSYVIVRLRTRDGTVGVGEAVVPGGPWWGGESVESMKAMIDGYLGPALLGLQAAHVEGLRARMAALIPGNNFAKAALEMAAFDAWGKATDMPLVDLLGGAFRDRLPVTWALSSGKIEEVIEEVRSRLALGNTRFKLKMGAVRRHEDLHRAEVVMSELEGRAELIVDPNGAWDETDARWFCRELAALGVASIEQPVPAWNHEALCRLARGSDIPLMADEGLITVHDALTLGRDSSVGIFAIKIPKAGGLINAITIARIGEATGRRCFGGSTLEGTIGAAASMALYCSRSDIYQCELIGPQLLADDVARGVIYDLGAVHLPTGPGLGIVLDEEKVAHYSR